MSKPELPSPFSGLFLTPKTRSKLPIEQDPAKILNCRVFPENLDDGEKWHAVTFHKRFLSSAVWCDLAETKMLFWRGTHRVLEMRHRHFFRLNSLHAVKTGGRPSPKRGGVRPSSRVRFIDEKMSKWLLRVAALADQNWRFPVPIQGSFFEIEQK